MQSDLYPTQWGFNDSANDVLCDTAFICCVRAAIVCSQQMLLWTYLGKRVAEADTEGTSGPWRQNVIQIDGTVTRMRHVQVGEAVCPTRSTDSRPVLHQCLPDILLRNWISFPFNIVWWSWWLRITTPWLTLVWVYYFLWQEICVDITSTAFHKARVRKAVCYLFSSHNAVLLLTPTQWRSNNC